MPRAIRLIVWRLVLLALGSIPGLSAAPSPFAPAQEGARRNIQEHDQTSFPLTGRHRTVACQECHINGQLEGTPTSCESCHWDRRQDDRYSLALGINCADCHDTTGWRPVSPDRWNHESVTGFRLEGTHRLIECTDCHANGFEGQSADCVSCHRKDFDDARDPNHVEAGFPTDCVTCHGDQATTWQGAEFDHSSFPLKGQHQTAACLDCHTNGVYQGLASDCVSCHRKDFDDARDPNHVEAGFPTDCVTCHGDQATTWQGAEFDHSSFPLKGQHQTAACTACHTNGVYQGLASDCVSCHRSEYDQTTGILTTPQPDSRRTA